MTSLIVDGITSRRNFLLGVACARDMFSLHDDHECGSCNGVGDARMYFSETPPIFINEWAYDHFGVSIEKWEIL